MRTTHVTFPHGQVSGRSTVVATVPADGRHGVVVAETPFHPLDHTWPDQPADRGTLDGSPVLDCVTGAARDGQVLLGSDIPVRRGDDGWAWLVVHVLDRPVPVGAEVELEADPAYRAALSAGHTGCHLAALALNGVLAGRWRKEVAPDSLGHPDFDQAAITSSRIVEHGSLDVYRLGKSLRRKGFSADGLDPVEIADQVNEVLKGWVAADAPVWVDAPGPELTARRTWNCDLPVGRATIPCGGTHVTRTGELGGVRVELSLEEAALTMRTTVGP
ncbi:metal-dependent hydrolase [Thermoactinospora rubra]|uniref:metal-dependent hydrolase n=1 Tax=Thermoactinospora rubra TaxID=1088767 RepID=UPI000A109EB6|nr:metal-dependent hydrolase [Thermoactinospora rubra]